MVQMLKVPLNVKEQFDDMFLKRIADIESFIEEIQEEIDWFCDHFKCTDEVEYKVRAQQTLDLV